jgi:carboxylate-amine ligase
MPRTGLPERFDSYEEYQRTVQVLVNAGMIEDATKIWWDLRPSDRFPTLEMRITDICTRLDDALTIAAIFRCLCRMLWRLRRNNQRWRYYSNFLIDENRWLAQRFGVDAKLIDYGRGECVPYIELADELIELLRDDAEFFDCLDELEQVRDIARHGTSADRQIKLYRDALEDGASEEDAMKAVVDHLIAETAAV